MKITVRKARKSELAVVRNLAGYYVYDMSEYMGWACDKRGRFGDFEGMERYWERKDRWAFAIKVGKEWAGFALVLGDGGKDGVDYSITAFFVMRKFRRHGVGEEVARKLFERFKGRWKVDFFEKNRAARGFWRKVVSEYTRGRFKESVKKNKWGKVRVLRFGSRGNDRSSKETN